MKKPWWVQFYQDSRKTAAAEAYAAFVRDCAAAPEQNRLRESAGRAGPYPAGLGGGWRYRCRRLPVHGRLQNAYGLKEIAGQGETFERALRVMDWLCAHTYYKGVSFGASMRFGRSPYRGGWGNSLRMLRYACGRPIARSLNCGYIGIVLADCLVAAGIAAMPVNMINYIYRAGEEKTKLFPNHTVVHVWLPEERRWVMLDPSLDSYISDETGRALHLIEIHERRRKGQEIRVAQYALNRTQDCRDVYLDYFVLGSLLEILVWNDSSRKGAYLRLLPEDVPTKESRIVTAAELLAEPKYE